MEHGTATGVIAAHDPPSDFASSVPALILPTPDCPDPPSDLDLASSVPALSLPTRDGPALSNPTPDGFPPSPDDHFLPPPGWLESPDPSPQIVVASASPISVLAASESSSDVAIPTTLQSQLDPVFSAPVSLPAQLHCDIDPVSALVQFYSTPSPVPSLSPAPTLENTASPALQESVVAETVARLSAVTQQKGLAFDVSTLSQLVQDARPHPLQWIQHRDPSLHTAELCLHTTNFLLSYFFKPALFRATTLQKVSPGYTHKHGAELGKYKLQVTKHKVGYDASIKQ